MKVTVLDGITIIESEPGLYITTVVPSELKETKMYLGSGAKVEDYKEVSDVPVIEIPEEPDLDKQEEELCGYSLKEAYYLLLQENEKLKEYNDIQDILIDINMMATDEVFSMIEPLIAMPTNILEGGVSPMVDMYVAMVQRGLKTIEEIPARYRAEVERIIKQLEA